VVGAGRDPERPWVRLVGQPPAEQDVEIGATLAGEPIEIAAVLGAGAEVTEVQDTLRSMHCAQIGV
jgi:hypothetical protein